MMMLAELLQLRAELRYQALIGQPTEWLLIPPRETLLTRGAQDAATPAIEAR